MRLCFKLKWCSQKNVVFLNVAKNIVYYFVNVKESIWLIHPIQYFEWNIIYLQWIGLEDMFTLPLGMLMFSSGEMWKTKCNVFEFLTRTLIRNKFAVAHLTDAMLSTTLRELLNISIDLEPIKNGSNIEIYWLI